MLWPRSRRIFTSAPKKKLGASAQLSHCGPARERNHREQTRHRPGKTDPHYSRPEKSPAEPNSIRNLQKKKLGVWREEVPPLHVGHGWYDDERLCYIRDR
jgi:hypothetical protein